MEKISDRDWSTASNRPAITRIARFISKVLRAPLGWSRTWSGPGDSAEAALDIAAADNEAPTYPGPA